MNDFKIVSIKDLQVGMRYKYVLCPNGFGSYVKYADLDSPEYVKTKAGKVRVSSHESYPHVNDDEDIRDIANKYPKKKPRDRVFSRSVAVYRQPSNKEYVFDYTKHFVAGLLAGSVGIFVVIVVLLGHIYGHEGMSNFWKSVVWYPDKGEKFSLTVGFILGLIFLLPITIALPSFVG